jgi:group I intron endonuclease
VDFLEKIVLKSNSRIYKALLDDGYGGFTLEILEYCDKNNLIKREQHYIDILKPEYNI